MFHRVKLQIRYVVILCPSLIIALYRGKDAGFKTCMQHWPNWFYRWMFFLPSNLIKEFSRNTEEALSASAFYQHEKSMI